MIEGPAPTEEEKSRSLIEAAEARVSQSATFTWTVPGLALAGQAFLLTIALDPSSTPWRRVVVAVAGIATISAAGQFMGKQVFNFDMYEAVIERERVKLGLPRLTRDCLLDDIGSFPTNTLLRRRRWVEEDDEELTGINLRKRLTRLFTRVRNRLIVRWKSVWVWGVALGVLFAIDVGILVWALVDVL